MPIPVPMMRASEIIAEVGNVCSAQLPALQQTQVFRSALVDYLIVLTIFFSILGVTSSSTFAWFLSSAFSQSAD
jgi:hypothetical protein